jgi:hypothetical protein
MLVEQFGTSSWSTIAARMPGRNVRQCRDRWKHYLSAQIKQPWSAEEDCFLVQQVQHLGLTWSRIAATLPNRTDFEIRARWSQIFPYIQAQPFQFFPPTRNEMVRFAEDAGGRPMVIPPAMTQVQVQKEVRPRFPSLVLDPACKDLFPRRIFEDTPTRPLLPLFAAYEVTALCNRASPTVFGGGCGHDCR